jgi:hypothetical protein
MTGLVLASALAVAATLLTACTDAPQTGPPAATRTPHTTAEADITALLGRPMRLPTVAPGEPCPVSGTSVRSPSSQDSTANGLGTGPLYPTGFYLGAAATLSIGERTVGPDGRYDLKEVWASTTSTGYRGPAVVRVDRIDGPGEGHVELYYDPQASRGDAVVFELSDFPRDWPSGTFVSGPGCYAYQIDGLTFDEVLVFRVVA